MKYTIMGFKQENLLKFSLDLLDIAILRYFIDSVRGKKLEAINIDGKLYYWICYDDVLKEFPIFDIKKCTVQARFFKLRDAGILTHKVVRDGGKYSYFGIGKRYAEIIEDMNLNNEDSMEVEAETEVKEKEKFNEENNVLKGVDENLQDIEENSQGVLKELDDNIDNREYEDVCKNSYGVDINPQRDKKYPYPCGFKSITNNPSTKYLNIKKIKNKKKTKKMVFLQKTVFEIRGWRYARGSFEDRGYFKDRTGSR